MIHAKENDFDAVKDIFYQHKEWFPHVRTDYMRREIASGNLILDNDVVITYGRYKRAYHLSKAMGNVNSKVIMQNGDVILHQIAAKHRNGSASDALQRFFRFAKGRVWLSVRSDNEIAKKFYLKNGMTHQGTTSWTKDGVKNALPGDIYCYGKVEGPFE